MGKPHLTSKCIYSHNCPCSLLNCILKFDSNEQPRWGIHLFSYHEILRKQRKRIPYLIIYLVLYHDIMLPFMRITICRLLWHYMWITNHLIRPQWARRAPPPPPCCQVEGRSHGREVEGWDRGLWWHHTILRYASLPSLSPWKIKRRKTRRKPQQIKKWVPVVAVAVNWGRLRPSQFFLWAAEN